MKKWKDPREEKAKILVIPQLTRIGDLVCSTPVFGAIKKGYPASRLVVLVSRKAVGIIKNNPNIDQIIIWEEFSFWGLVRQIRRGNFDWSFSLVGSSQHTLLCFLGLIPNRVKTIRFSRPISECLTDWMANHRIVYQDHTFLPDHYLKLLEPIGIFNPKSKKEVYTTKSSEEKVDQFIIEHTISKQTKLIGISITAGNKIKEWGDEKFVKLSRLIHKYFDCTLIFIGAPSESSRVTNVIKQIDGGANVQATSFSIEELPSLINRLSLFIAVDTGLIYIAHALGVPLIDIIGPVDPREQPPDDELSIQILPNPNVRPSSFVFKKPGEAHEHRLAIESIKVEDVLTAVRRLI